MNVIATPRDYGLLGRDAKIAEEMGLASAQWYQCPMPRKRLKELMQRRDGPAIRDSLIWFASFLVSGGLAYYFWPTWAALPFFLIYGVLYGSSSDSRWHECGHGTAFKTRWMNDAIYHIACFMIMREPTVWRWSHTRHHTDTIIVGRDPEIAVMRPVMILKIIAAFFAIPQTWSSIKSLVRHAFGKIGDEEATFIPEMERSRMYMVARIWLLIHVAVIAIAYLFGIHSAHAVRGAAANHVRGLGPCPHGPHPAWRTGGECAGPPPQQPHGLHESGFAVHLLEHELPHRASHVSHGALSRASGTAQGLATLHAAAKFRHHRCLP